MASLPSAIGHMVREPHNFFAHSGTRQAAYAESYKKVLETNEDDYSPPKILAVSDTRWLAIAEHTEAILPQYEGLKHFFGQLQDRNYNMCLQRDMYSDPRNQAYLVFLAAVLHNVKRVNKVFQRESTDPLRLFQELENLYVETLSRILRPALLRHNSSAALQCMGPENMESIFLDRQTLTWGITLRRPP